MPILRQRPGASEGRETAGLGRWPARSRRGCLAALQDYALTVNDTAPIVIGTNDRESVMNTTNDEQREDSRKKSRIFQPAITAIRWLTFIPVGMLCMFLLELLFVMGLRFFFNLWYADSEQYLLAIIFAVFVFPWWCIAVIMMPIVVCGLYAPRQRIASVLLGIVYAAFIVELITNSNNFPQFVLISHIVTSVLLAIGIVSAFVGNTEAKKCQTEAKATLK